MKEFVQEIRDDLPKLIERFPLGIYMADLTSEYGETPARIGRACRILEEEGSIKMLHAASKANYILPQGYTPTIPFMNLTDLQRKLLMYLCKICKEHHTIQIKSNYSQLSRIMSCSYGGLHSCLNRLAALAYIVIDSESQRGRQDMLVVTIGKEMVDYNLSLDVPR